MSFPTLVPTGQFESRARVFRASGDRFSAQGVISHNSLVTFTLNIIPDDWQ